MSRMELQCPLCDECFPDGVKLLQHVDSGHEEVLQKKRLTANDNEAREEAEPDVAEEQNNNVDPADIPWYLKTADQIRQSGLGQETEAVTVKESDVSEKRELSWFEVEVEKKKSSLGSSDKQDMAKGSSQRSSVCIGDDSSSDSSSDAEVLLPWFKLDNLADIRQQKQKRKRKKLQESFAPASEAKKSRSEPVIVFTSHQELEIPDSDEDYDAPFVEKCIEEVFDRLEDAPEVAEQPDVSMANLPEEDRELTTLPVEVKDEFKSSKLKEKCPECQLDFEDLELLSHHYNRRHRPCYDCPKASCAAKFMVKSMLRAHVSLVHAAWMDIPGKEQKHFAIYF